MNPSQQNRRRLHQKPPKDEEKGDQELDDDRNLNRLVADQEMQSSLQASLPLRMTCIEEYEDVTMTVCDTAAKRNENGIRRRCRWTHIEREGINLHEFQDLVMQVFYTPPRDPILEFSQYILIEQRFPISTALTWS